MYVLTNKWTLVKKYRIPRIQSTELKKVKNQKGPSEDASIPLGREKKTIRGGRGRERPRWKRGNRGENGNNKVLGGQDRREAQKPAQ